MPIQELENNSLAGSLGRSTGDALSGSLQALINHKTEKMLKKNEYEKTVKGLKALGIDNAEGLAHLDPKLLEQVVKSKLGEANEQEFARQLAQRNGSSQTGSLDQLSGQPAPEQQPPQEEKPFSLDSVTPEQKQQIRAYLGSPEASKSHTPEQLAKVQNFLDRPEKQSPVQQPQAQKKAPVGRLNAKQALELAKLDQAEKKISQKERHFEKQLERDERKEALAETKEIRKELFAKKKSAQETIDSIDEMEELEKEGLPGAGQLELLKSLGLDIPALKGAPAEQWEKIAATFVRGAKAQFGARLTDTDLNLFLKQVPSLANSTEGRSRIYATMRRLANLDKAAVDAYEDIVNKNGGIPPLDLDLQLDKALDKKRDAVYKQFKKDLAKEVPEGESKLTTALLTGAGKLIGRIPGAMRGGLEGAAAGAYIGSKGGPIGALTGAGIGAVSGAFGITPSSTLRSIL